jgi:hypothetical protein
LQVEKTAAAEWKRLVTWDLANAISDPLIGFGKTVSLASNTSDTDIKTINVLTNAADPFVNIASVTWSLLNSLFSMTLQIPYPTKLSSDNEIKKFAGFLGFVFDKNTKEPVASVAVVIIKPDGKTVLATVYTDEDGYYMYPPLGSRTKILARAAIPQNWLPG